VSEGGFENELALAAEASLAAVDRPHISRGQAAVLKKAMSGSESLGNFPRSRRGRARLRGIDVQTTTRPQRPLISKYPTGIAGREPFIGLIWRTADRGQRPIGVNAADDYARPRVISALKMPLGQDQAPEMIRIALAKAAYDAIRSALPKGVARWPMQSERGKYFIQVEAAVVDRMRSMRRSAESCSTVILRFVELEAQGSA
jgi:hypothetical protein